MNATLAASVELLRKACAHIVDLPKKKKKCRLASSGKSSVLGRKVWKQFDMTDGSRRWYIGIVLRGERNNFTVMWSDKVTTNVNLRKELKEGLIKFVEFK